MPIGVCYFPEHWPEDEWERDVEEMAANGITHVRMAEFAWSRLEPRRGEFRFGWLEEVIGLIEEHGMNAVLCTPTAAPPKWLIDEHPEIRQEEPDGTVRDFGSRRHYCFNSPVFREESDRIVERLARRFAEDPTVVGWQTDNEYGWSETGRCYCDDCARAFRSWLEGKFGTIDALNEAWGTTFWSQRYDSFAEIDPPRHTAGEHHPSKVLEYYRFSSDSMVEFNRRQVEILRSADPVHTDGNDQREVADQIEREPWFVTHNFMYDFDELDAYAMGADLDFASWDSYPTAVVQRYTDTPSVDEVRVGDPDMTGMNHDLYRTVAGDRFWVMEQQPGDIDWPAYSTHPDPNALRLWPQQATAHGAEEVCYFRWRRCREGQEQYLTGLLDHDRSPNDGLEAANDVAADLGLLEDLDTVDAPVAIVHDYDNLWATSIQPHSPDFDYWTHMRTYYRALRSLGVSVDIVSIDASFEAYEAIVAPTLHLVKPDLVRDLEAFVDDGGALLLTMRSGVKDVHNKLLDGRIPGPLSDLVGGTVDAFESVPPSVETVIDYRGTVYDASVWVEALAPDGADVLGTHLGGRFEGASAITTNEFGEGRVTYCGVWPRTELARRLVSDVLSETTIDVRTTPLPDRVRLLQRRGHTWVMNFSGESIRVETDGEVVLGTLNVEPYGFVVVAGDQNDLEIE